MGNTDGTRKSGVVMAITNWKWGWSGRARKVDLSQRWSCIGLAPIFGTQDRWQRNRHPVPFPLLDMNSKSTNYDNHGWFFLLLVECRLYQASHLSAWASLDFALICIILSELAVGAAYQPQTKTRRIVPTFQKRQWKQCHLTVWQKVITRLDPLDVGITCLLIWWHCGSPGLASRALKKAVSRDSSVFRKGTVDDDDRSFWRGG